MKDLRKEIFMLKELIIERNFVKKALKQYRNDIDTYTTLLGKFLALTKQIDRMQRAETTDSMLESFLNERD